MVPQGAAYGQLASCAYIGDRSEGKRHENHFLKWRVCAVHTAVIYEKQDCCRLLYVLASLFREDKKKSWSSFTGALNIKTYKIVTGEATVTMTRVTH